MKLLGVRFLFCIFDPWQFHETFGTHFKFDFYKMKEVKWFLKSRMSSVMIRREL